jgi:putative intracellular protease/amidase/uncharacterized protein (DUF952 family)
MRWLYHLTDRTTSLHERYRPESLQREGFIHCSYASDVAESARRYFRDPNDVVAWRIDPRRVDVPLRVEGTPRGAMPHIYGAISSDAVRDEFAPSAWSALPDTITAHRIAFVAFSGMTLLDLVGVYDPVSRIRTMGTDADLVTDIVSATDALPWSTDGASLTVNAVRPSLLGYDLVVVAGGVATRELCKDETILAWLRTRPAHRAWASVCTGSLLLAAAGVLKGRSATTHHTALDLLAAYDNVTVVRERVVHTDNIVTAAGVTSALDLGISLVSWLTDEATTLRIREQMEYPRR